MTSKAVSLQLEGQCHENIEGQGHNAYKAPKYDIQYGDVQNCPQLTDLKTDKTYVLEPLPGEGWDNLRNVGMGTVLMLNYSNCRVTSDRKFLIPDNADVQALKESNVHVYSSVISNSTDYTSMTSRSINVQAHAAVEEFGVSGSFSTEYMNAKKQIGGNKGVTSRSELRFRQYDIRMQPDSKPHPIFQDRILDIASFLQANDTTHARYLSDLLVRYYGTHYVIQVDAGAFIAQEDQLNATYVTNIGLDATVLKASASAVFASAFLSAGGSAAFAHTATEEQVEAYKQSRVDTHVYTHGGPSFNSNFTISNWLDGIDNNLVTMDRTGEPLYYVLTSGAFPMIPLDTLRDVSQVVEEAVISYYSHNTYRGCTSVDKPNFSYIANLDDGTCRDSDRPNNHSFGGVFQNCTGPQCQSSWTQFNPKTNASSCPPQYIPTLFIQDVRYQQETKTTCQRHCKSFLGIKHNCHDDCSTVPTTPDVTTVETYWCAANDANVASESGYLFGGVYTDTTPNVLTKAKRCPLSYVALRLGLDTAMYVCVSDDQELGYRYSVPFGGFFSCDAGNPLALRHDITASQVQLQT